MNGWTRKMLRVNLSEGSTSIEEIDGEILQKYLGGRGLGAYLVYTEVPPETDPLGEDNILAFCNGAMTGIQIPTGGRSSLSTLSPLTGTIFDANSGSQFGVRLRWAGYDALVITGASPSPVWFAPPTSGVLQWSHVH